MRVGTCLWTTTDDDHFLVGRPDGYDSLTVGTGFSGRGFNFATVLGEALADPRSPTVRRATTSASWMATGCEPRRRVPRSATPGGPA
jgi:hypothetical protein